MVEHVLEFFAHVTQRHAYFFGPLLRCNGVFHQVESRHLRLSLGFEGDGLLRKLLGLTLAEPVFGPFAFENFIVQVVDRGIRRTQLRTHAIERMRDRAQFVGRGIRYRVFEVAVGNPVRDVIQLAKTAGQAP
jgi:hypothetical protein